MSVPALPKIIEKLKDHATHQGDALAFKITGSLNESIDYATLEQQSRIIAHQLQLQYAPGDRILFLLPNGLDFILCLLACFQSGLIAVPFAPPNPKRQTASLVSLLLTTHQIQPSAIITTETIKNGLTALPAPVLQQAHQLCHNMGISTNETNLPPLTTAPELRQNPSNAALIVPKQDTAFIQFSSGSTARPKGIVIQHHNMVHNIIGYGKGITKGAHLITWLPLFHDFGLMNGILAPLYFGVPSILTQPTDFIFNPASWLQLISQYPNVVTAGPNFALNLCLRKIPKDHPRFQLESLDYLVLGSEKNHPETLHQFYQRFRHHGLKKDSLTPSYGLAETTIAATTRYGNPLLFEHFDHHQLQQGFARPCAPSDPNSIELVCAGTAIDQHQVSIRDPKTKQLLEAQHVGEIWFCGPSVSPGYWNNTQATEQHFVTLAGTRYLRTGDLGFLYQKQLFFVGRIKTQISHRGRNIAASDIEWVIQQTHPIIAPSGVCAVSMNSKEATQEGLALFIECKPNQPQCLNTFLQSLHQSISLHFSMRITLLVLMPKSTLHRTTSGKLRHRHNLTAFHHDQLPYLLSQYCGDTPKYKADKKELTRYFTIKDRP